MMHMRRKVCAGAPILIACAGAPILHHAPEGLGHAGIEQTLHVMHQHFHWRGVKADITSYIASCDSCQRNKLIILDLPECKHQQSMVPCGMCMLI